MPSPSVRTVLPPLSSRALSSALKSRHHLFPGIRGFSQLHSRGWETLIVESSRTAPSGKGVQVGTGSVGPLSLPALSPLFILIQHFWISSDDSNVSAPGSSGKIWSHFILRSRRSSQSHLDQGLGREEFQVRQCPEANSWPAVHLLREGRQRTSLSEGKRKKKPLAPEMQIPPPELSVLATEGREA
jgi:hypothetical protein